MCWRIRKQRLAEGFQSARSFAVKAEEALAIKQRKAMFSRLSWPSSGIAVHIPEGINIAPKWYLEALWRACQSFSEDTDSRGILGTAAVLHKHHVTTFKSSSGWIRGVAVRLLILYLRAHDIVIVRTPLSCRFQYGED